MRCEESFIGRVGEGLGWKRGGSEFMLEEFWKEFFSDPRELDEVGLRFNEIGICCDLCLFE